MSDRSVATLKTDYAANKGRDVPFDDVHQGLVLRRAAELSV